MDCDALAPYYRFVEYLAFGGKLQKHRLRFLESVRGAHNALVLGDGDGRFVKQLTNSFPQLRTDVIELSKKMIELAQPKTRSRVNFVHGDARSVSFPAPAYDVFATHFFLDCFEAADLRKIAAKIASHAAPDAIWIVSEFRNAKGFWRGLHAKFWLCAMYLFFRVATGLKTRTLPNHREILVSNGFTLITETTSMCHFIASELWRYEPSGLESENAGLREAGRVLPGQTG